MSYNPIVRSTATKESIKYSSIKIIEYIDEVILSAKCQTKEDYCSVIEIEKRKRKREKEMKKSNIGHLIFVT